MCNNESLIRMLMISKDLHLNVIFVVHLYVKKKVILIQFLVLLAFFGHAKHSHRLYLGVDFIPILNFLMFFMFILCFVSVHFIQAALRILLYAVGGNQIHSH